LSRVWHGWRGPLHYVQADTVVRWERERFRRFWAQAFLLGFPLAGATRGFRGAVLAFVPGFSSRPSVTAWSSVRFVVIVNSPLAVMTAVRTSITLVAPRCKAILLEIESWRTDSDDRVCTGRRTKGENR